MLWGLPVESFEWKDELTSICNNIRQRISKSSFAADILEKQGIRQFLMHMQSLSNGVWMILDKEQSQIPGAAVYVFEVEVTFETDDLTVIEKVVSFLYIVFLFLS